MLPTAVLTYSSMQVPDAEKCKRADYVIDTGASLEATTTAIKALVGQLQSKPGKVLAQLAARQEAQPCH